MKTVYVFSGLGADERVFRKTDFGNCLVVFIKWITPFKNEPIESYALRITQQITTPHPILLGLSFGGMMAVEVAKYIYTEKIILISSAKNKNEIPFYFRLVGKLGIAKIIPSKALIKINVFTNRFFSNRTVEDKKLLSAILHDTDPVFLKWAIVKIANWQNTATHQNLYHIHGNADKILPFKYISATEVIHNGAHLMIVSSAADVNIKLRMVLN